MRAIDLFRVRTNREWERMRTYLALEGELNEAQIELLHRMFRAGTVAGGLALLAVVSQVCDGIEASTATVASARHTIRKTIEDLQKELPRIASEREVPHA